MHISKLLQLLPLAGGLVAGSLYRRDDGTLVDAIDATKKFIIEVKKGVNVEALAKKLDAHEHVKILNTYNSDVFKGLSIESGEHNLDTLNEVTEVEQAWAASYVDLPIIEEQSLGKISDAANYSIHQWTGVDKVHAAGYRGKGVKVAIVDTGVDYNHPALGGGFGPGFKVSGGYDLVGEESPIKNGQPDSDPLDIRGHGTHVAGIVAGKNDWFTGVAPDAELLAYKVFSATTGGTYDNFVIDAFLLAYEAGADVITCSIGSWGGWSNGPWATIASRIAEQGVIVTISASNDGKQGAFYANTGSSGKEAIAVASAKAGTLAAHAFELTSTINGETTRTKLAYRFNNPWSLKDVPIYPLFPDNTTTEQACTPEAIPSDTPDLSDKIVLVRRGGCEYIAQEWNLKAYNANHILFYNTNGSRPDDPTSQLSGLKAIIEEEAGEFILETVKAGGKVTADFLKYDDAEWYVGISNGVGNRPSYFTSWGGLYDLDLKPDVTAPGGEILSTWAQNTWRVDSGTSMACPYVAGVAALYINRFGGRSVQGSQLAKVFNNKLRASASAMPWSIVDSIDPVDTGFWAPTIQAGTGFLNAWKLLNFTTTLSTTKFLLNDTSNFVGHQSVDITNTANVDATYQFSLQPAAGIEAADSSGVWIAPLTDLQPLKMVPSVQFPAGTFKLSPGETKRAEFVFDYPRGLNETRQPLYSGKILISSTLGEQLSVGYFGAAYSLRDRYKKMFIDSTVKMRVGETDVATKPSWSFDVRTTGPTPRDWPRVLLSLIFGCDELRWDIFESGWTESRWTYPPVVGQNGYVGSATSFKDASKYNTFDPAVHDKEDTIPFPMRAIGRSTLVTTFLGYTTQEYIWLGKLANGTYLAPGTYKMRFAALRPLGNRSNSSDWDIWETPEVTILPIAN